MEADDRDERRADAIADLQTKNTLGTYPLLRFALYPTSKL